MGGFRRFLLFVFFLAGVLCLAALALPWVGPYQQEATALMDNTYYFTGVVIAFCITVAGLVVVLLRTLFTPRKRKTVIVGQMGHDSISVSTSAISSQAAYVIENQDRFVAEKVKVSAKKKGKVRVDVRVRPRYTVDVAREGRQLHDDLATGLAAICGDTVSRVNLEFVEAEQPAPAQDVLVERIDEPAGQLQNASGDVSFPLGAAAVEPARPEVEPSVTFEASDFNATADATEPAEAAIDHAETVEFEEA